MGPRNHPRPASPVPASPVPASPVPASPVPADDDVYVYRDASEPPGYHPAAAAAAPGQGSEEDDASYWYDLSGKDSAPVSVPAETRGPFEPLVSSTGPRPGTPPPSEDGPTSPDDGGDHSDEDSAHARARKLEQIKDFYLTAEAIGDQNVDKHFDQLLAQQRELISEYFKPSEATRPSGDLAARAGTQAETQAGTQARSQAGTPVGADPDAAPGESAIAEQPRAS